MELTRRKFTQAGVLAGAAALLGGSPMSGLAQSAMTAQELVNKITAIMGPAWNPASVRDTFKMGDPNTPVQGVAACFMSTFDVIKRAQAKGLNFVITHEPTMWTDADLLPGVEHDPLFKLKLEFVNDHKMIVWRTHDSLHRMRPEPMITAENKKLGWDKFTVPGDAKTYEFSPAMPLREVVEEYVKKVPTNSVRVIGDPSLEVASATQCGHGCVQNIVGLEKYDATLSIEAREWETAEYGRDLVATGAKKAMIICSHESGEENMMQWYTGWFQQQFPGIRIEFVPTGDRMWTL
jgi:Duf34/NIF3 (NGG1p interacting factor 3)